MTKHNFKFTIEARTEKDAEEKIKALTVLAAMLSAKELAKLAQVVTYDPIKTAMAKTYLGL
ncbi:hypothetical protein [Chitinophaga agri]|uniref:Uncharacterized protein n=1 Tax=Chitinophaga agri TaxID=2703787 RepID=A0A6B9ZH60_9BACT|nr:hypothetical protein [Chitinophaga agri]QHS60831.1 hypothetical protein GWR21_14870 [Chitinophaga agri]